MDCCGHALTRRNWMWGTILTSVGAVIGGGLEPRGSTAAAQTAATASAALEILRNSISVDVHTHGGTTGITSKAPPSGDLANGMRAGSLAVACFADVPGRSHPWQECGWHSCRGAHAGAGPAL